MNEHPPTTSAYRLVARQGRDIWRGGLAAFPFVTLALIVLCCAMFALEVNRYGWDPSAYHLYEAGGTTRDSITSFDLRRISMANFLHLNVVHLINNMLVIWILGAGLEMLVGKRRLLALIALACVASSILSGLMSAQNVVSVGASGIAFALIACAVVIDLKAEIGIGQIAWQLLILNAVITFTSAGISIGAHVGGAISGAAAGVALRPGVRRKLGAPTRTSSAAVEHISPISTTGYASEDVQSFGPTRWALPVGILMVGGGFAFAPTAIHDSDPQALFVLFFPVIGAIGIVNALPGATRLTFKPEGFVIHTYWRDRRSVRWSAIAAAWLEEHGNQKGVYYRLHDEYRKPGTLRAYDGSITSRKWNTTNKNLAGLFADNAPEAWQGPRIGPNIDANLLDEFFSNNWSNDTGQTIIKSLTDGTPIEINTGHIKLSIDRVEFIATLTKGAADSATLPLSDFRKMVEAKLAGADWRTHTNEDGPTP